MAVTFLAGLNVCVVCYTYVGPQSLWGAERKREGMAEANLSTLNSFGEPFMDAVCKNACSGHDVAKVCVCVCVCVCVFVCTRVFTL